MSSTVRAQFWLMLPTRVISPLRTYQTVPLMSRTRVTRRLTASTVPIASPRSISSPTPYWSSKIMKIPARKSLTRLCAPKPRASPRIPALATIGAMSTPTSARTMVVTTARITPVMRLLRRLPIALARCTRRVATATSRGAVWPAAPRVPPSESRPTRSGRTPCSALRTSRSTVRCRRKRIRTATARMPMMTRGLPTMTSANSARSLLPKRSIAVSQKNCPSSQGEVSRTGMGPSIATHGGAT